FRDVYASMNAWLVRNQDARRIAYTFHTGDIVEKWTRQVDVEGRAREQFQAASDLMKILERAGHPHGVVPGNHDNITGRSNDLFNEYFPPSRYERTPWWGDSWRRNDNLNHYDVIEVDGAKFLMLYLGYFGGPCSWPQATKEARAWCADKSPDDTIEWANRVIAKHRDHNVIVATHNYINSNGSLASPDTSRWNEIGYRYWEEVIFPNENVFMVLSGHNQAVALNIKRDVGGVKGRIVVEMMADYAGHMIEGRRAVGFLRLLQVDVDAKTMAVNSYSPWLDEHNAWEYDRFTPSRYDDSDDEFTIEIDINDIYDKRVETSLIGVSAPLDDLGAVPAEADTEATLTWESLKPRTSYHWYAEARDAAGTVARSAARTFTTGR
ncbi:MAG TPA: metallophosphoesterase, partial [Actinopolymorphaceae bacterium]